MPVPFWKKRDTHEEDFWFGDRSKGANLDSLQLFKKKINKNGNWWCKYEMKELPKDESWEGIMKASVETH